MDPTNNLVPGDATNPAEPVIDTAALEAAMADINPAADVADAAIGGATPVVTTTDDNAADVAPEPALQTPVLSPDDTTAVAEPLPEGPVSLTPSSDFQMSETSTVSAVQSGADGNLAANNEEVMIGQPLEETPASETTNETSEMPDDSNTGTAPADFNDPEAEAQAEAKALAAKKEKDEEDDEPIVAAAPVPGSIGSAKSYVDIQRAEAEKAAKMAAKNEMMKKFDKKTVTIIAIIAVVVISIIIVAIVLISGNSTPANPTPAPQPVEEEHEYSTLSCRRNLAPEEYSSFGAVKGTQENIFHFKDDELDSLATNFAYTYANQALAEQAVGIFKRDYGITDDQETETNDTDNEEKDAEKEENSDSGKKTTAEMLHHYVTIENLTVTHGMEVKSEDIADWLESDAYSDVTYGATENGDEEETGEVVRNLKYYNRLQNSIDYTCQISKGV